MASPQSSYHEGASLRTTFTQCTDGETSMAQMHSNFDQRGGLPTCGLLGAICHLTAGHAYVLASSLHSLKRATRL
jgi:hypothetical protein